MIEKKKKKCKGTGKANGFKSCGELVYTFRYGLCQKCYAKWLYSTEEGLSLINKKAKIAKVKVEKENKAELRKRKQESNSSSLMKLADTYFSRYIRLLFSEELPDYEDRVCTCYTCGKVLPIKEVDNGHYLKREHKATRYHENNCRPQCKTCNGDIKHNGKQVEFRINLINEIGKKRVRKIEGMAKHGTKADSRFYRQVADIYRNKLNELQKSLNIKVW